MTQDAPLPTCQLPDSLEPILGPHTDKTLFSPMERVLLACDGTFTFQLEALIGERIRVQILKYERVEATENVLEHIQTHSGSEIWERKVILTGASSDTHYVFAHSFIVHDNLPDALREDLRHSPAGIGRLFVDYKLSIYRELVGYFTENGAEYRRHLPDFTCETLLSRVYRVFVDARPAMLITEKIPRDLFYGEGKAQSGLA